ncbi:MAG: contact-dependent growth inhibition system immunity protein [Rickettsiaceae bacterium]|nr:contact-dependent growth inhibition system immunity protein [Rickettsiaceae bacterium]
MDYSIRAYLRNEKIYLQAYSLVVKNGISSVLTLHGPVSIFEVTEQEELIGRGILEKFKDCGIVEEMPSEHQILKATGAKTWNALEKTSKSIGARLVDNNVIFTPYKYAGRSGYLHLNEKALTSDLAPENLGKALLDAFKRCE